MSDVKLPDGWEVKKLGEISDINMGQSPDSSTVSENEIGIPFLQGCAEFGLKYPKIKYYCKSPKKIAKRNSILISVRAPVGDTNFANIKFCIGRGLASIFSYTNNIIFLHNYLIFTKAELDKVSQGSTFLAINYSDLYNHQILLPKSLPEQKKIAEILTTIDNTIEKTEQLIEKLKNIKKGLMHDLFTRGVDENGQLRPPYEEAPHLYKESELGWIPKEWEVLTAMKTMEIINGGTPSTSNPQFWNGSINWLSVEDFNTGFRYVYTAKKKITTKGLNNSSTRILRTGMLIISARGTVGVLSQLGNDMAFNQSCYGLDCKHNSITNDYLYFYLLNYLLQLKSISFGGVFDTITQESFNKIYITIPNKYEAINIVDILNTQEIKIEKEIKGLTKLNKLKQGLMEDLLTGKVRVTSLLKKDTP